ncbi:hypothetical protein IPL85_00625 [Candidatus Saccharibacteria bacterium]|nr:MAG: hypothetical protein IPL85_00625 [Candidatus Saccharibacteria bacterium]
MAKKRLILLGYGLFALSWLLLQLAATLVYAQAQEERIAAKPFVATNIGGMGVTKDSKGVAYAVTMPAGINAPLQIINLQTMKRVYWEEQRKDGAYVSAEAYATLPNRHVFIGTSTGFVYDVDPDKLTVIEQTVPAVSGLSFGTATTGGDPTTVYVTARATGGEYIYGFNPVTADWRQVGQVPQASGLAYYDNKLFTGSSASPSISVFAASGGSGQQLSLAGLPTGTTSLKVDAISGEYLYVTATGVSAQTLAYNLKTLQLVDSQPVFGRVSLPFPLPKPAPAPVVSEKPVAQPEQITPQQVPQTEPTANQPPTQSQTGTVTTQNGNQNSTRTAETKPDAPSQTTPAPANAVPAQATQTQPTVAVVPEVVPSHIYYGALKQYDAAVKSTTSFGTDHALQPVSGNCWIDATRCVVYSPEGRLGIARSTTRKVEVATPSPLVGGYQPVSALVVAPDDTVYAAASTTRATTLQLDRDKTTLRKMIASSRGATTALLPSGAGVYAGTSEGTIARYDPSHETSTPRFENSVSVGAGSVTTLVQAGNKLVAFGLSQVGQTPSAALGLYNTSTNRVEVSAQPILTDQVLASAVFLGGTVYAGGSVPQAKETSSGGATLVAFDINSRSVTARLTPVPKAKSISSLAVGPNGHLYGVAGNTLFELDTVTKTVVQTKAFYDTAAPGNLVFHQGELYASVSGKIMQIRLSDFHDTVIASGSQVAINSMGDLYYARDGALYRIVAERQAVAGASTEVSNATPLLSLVDFRIGASSALLVLMLVALPILKLHLRRPTYSIHR